MHTNLITGADRGKVPRLQSPVISLVSQEHIAVHLDEAQAGDSLNTTTKVRQWRHCSSIYSRRPDTFVRPSASTKTASATTEKPSSTSRESKKAMAKKSSAKKPGKGTSKGAANQPKKPNKSRRRAAKKPAAPKALPKNTIMAKRTITTMETTITMKTTVTRETIAVKGTATPKVSSKKTTRTKRIAAAKPQKVSSKKAQAKKVSIHIPPISPPILISSKSLLPSKPPRLPEGEGGDEENKACDDTDDQDEHVTPADHIDFLLFALGVMYC